MFTVVVFLAGFNVHIWLSILYPALYGGDTVLRLRNHDHLLLSYQLPGLQVLIFLLYKLTAAPIGMKLLMASIAAIAGAGFYLVMSKLVGPVSAIWAALLFVTNPFLNEISIVPYQEMLMVAGLCIAVYFYAAGKPVLAALCLAVACLTRYEAWIGCPVFACAYAFKRPLFLRGLAAGLLLFGCAPVLWIAIHLGLSGPGSFVVELPHSLWRLERWVYIGWIATRNTPAVALAFATAGLFAVWKGKFLRTTQGKLFLAFVVMFFVAILFSAHGEPHRTSSDPERFVTSREATLPVVFTLLLAAFGIKLLLEKPRWRSLVSALAAAGVLWGALQSLSFIAQQTAKPDVQVSYRLARFLDRNVLPGERILLFTKPVSEADLALYFNKLKSISADSGLAKASFDMQTIDLSPPDFQRTAVQCGVLASQLAPSGDPMSSKWIVIWSDASPPPEVVRQTQRMLIAGVVSEGKLFAVIYQRPSGRA